MKNCPNCGKVLDDSAVFCPTCGANLQNGAQPNAAPAVNPFDHTAEFDAKDISDNKVIAMLTYLLGPIGIIISLLAASTSPYAAFHVRQALKFTVVEILLAIATALLAWTIIVPIAAGIAMIVLVVLEIIAFFQICNGKAVEPAIIRSLKFLK